MPSSDSDLSNVLVLIPALDEEKTIVDVIKQLKQAGLTHIRVVDNGSKDQTVTKAQEAGVEVLIESRKGYGQACWTGLQNLPDHIEWILFCDADGSDNFSKLSSFFKYRETHDLVLGNRRATPEGRQALTSTQNFGNWLATFLIRLGWGKSFHDLGPLRLIKRDALNRIQMKDRGFGWTVEMQAKAAEFNIPSIEVPVHYERRKGGRSKISGTLRGSIAAGTIILSTLFILFLEHIQKKLSHSSWQSFFLIASSLLLILGSSLMLPHGDFLQKPAVPSFLIAALIMSLGFILSWQIRSLSLFLFWSITILTRLIQLPMYPGDDIWRYLWEGFIQLHGYNPYQDAPSSDVLISLRTEWWHLINHKDISAIYPPLCQLIFRSLAFIAPSFLLFKSLFILFDLATCYLLLQRFSPKQVLLYAWNPLVIYCFAGGGHYDSMFIFFTVAGWFCYCSGKWKQAALWIGCSVAIKWVSLPFLAFLGWQTLQKKGIKEAFSLAFISTLPFICSLFLLFGGTNTASLIPKDFALYARSSELFPYFLSIIWEDSSRMNWIFIIPLTLALFYLGLKTKSFSHFAEWFYFCLFFFSPAIHAWYFTWILPFTVKTGNWGSRLISITAFTYFMLQYRKAIDDFSWQQPLIEKMILWLPFIVGFLYFYFLSPSISKKESS